MRIQVAFDVRTKALVLDKYVGHDHLSLLSFLVALKDYTVIVGRV